MPSKTQSILLAGVAVGVTASLLGSIPVAGGCLACLAYIAAGVIAVWHYTNTYAVTIPGGAGAGMGALAGLVAGIVSTLVGFALSATGLRPGYQEEMRRGLEESGISSEQMEQMTELITSPGFLVGIVIFGLILGAILGAVGGSVGSAMFKKGNNSLGSSPDVY